MQNKENTSSDANSIFESRIIENSEFELMQKYPSFQYYQVKKPVKPKPSKIIEFPILEKIMRFYVEN